jgi:hypothetical protein
VRVVVLEIGRERIAVRAPAVGRVDVAVAADDPGVDQAFGDLIGRVEVTAIALGGDAERRVRRRSAPAQQAVGLLVAVGTDERAVVVVELERVEQISRPDARRVREEYPVVAVVPDPQRQRRRDRGARRKRSYDPAVEKSPSSA